eukprot:scaffold44040_cov69-Phaeocystis_antarctica.AAC.5
MHHSEIVKIEIHDEGLVWAHSSSARGIRPQRNEGLCRLLAENLARPRVPHGLHGWQTSALVVGGIAKAHHHPAALSGDACRACVLSPVGHKATRLIGHDGVERVGPPPKDVRFARRLVHCRSTLAKGKARGTAKLPLSLQSKGVEVPLGSGGGSAQLCLHKSWYRLDANLLALERPPYPQAASPHPAARGRLNQRHRPLALLPNGWSPPAQVKAQESLVIGIEY